MLEDLHRQRRSSSEDAQSFPGRFLAQSLEPSVAQLEEVVLSKLREGAREAQLALELEAGLLTLARVDRELEEEHRQIVARAEIVRQVADLILDEFASDNAIAYMVAEVVREVYTVADILYDIVRRVRTVV